MTLTLITWEFYFMYRLPLAFPFFATFLIRSMNLLLKKNRTLCPGSVGFVVVIIVQLSA